MQMRITAKRARLASSRRLVRRVGRSATSSRTKTNRWATVGIQPESAASVDLAISSGLEAHRGPINDDPGT